MQVSVEVTTGLERRMTVELPSSEIDGQVDERLKKASSTVRLDGFRKGKIPMNVMRQRFGMAVRQEVLGEAINTSYGEAIAQEKIKPAGAPTIDSVDAESNAEAVTYTAVFEVYPDFELGDFTSISIEKASSSVSDQDVADMIESLQKQNTVWNSVDRKAQDGDQVNIDFVGTIDGEEFEGGSATGSSLVLGSGQMIPGFESGVLGMAAEETRNVEVTFPEDYQAENLRGKNAVFAITVNEVQDPTVPDVDADFMEKFGVKDGDLDGFKDQIRSGMERELSTTQASVLKNQVMEAVAELHELTLPQAMVKEEIGRVKGEMFQQYGGGNENLDLSQFPDEPFVEQAEGRVKLGLIISEVVSKAEIKVDQDRVKSEISALAASYDDPQQVEQYYFSNEQALNSVQMKVLEDQVVDHILEQASVTETQLSYQELMQKR